MRAGEFISQEFAHFAERATLLLVSGGSSLNVLNQIPVTSLRSNMAIGQVDERWTKTERDLNATAFRKTEFSKRIAAMGIPFVTMDTLGTTGAGECALRYERYLKQWRSIFYGGATLAILGIGEDGHIAGILPFPDAPDDFNKLFYDNRSWVVGYETGGKGEFPARVTLSMHYLFQEVTTAFVYACGNTKKPALEKTFAPDGTFAETPARILNQMPSVFLFSDIV